MKAMETMKATKAMKKTVKCTAVKAAAEDEAGMKLKNKPGAKPVMKGTKAMKVTKAMEKASEDEDSDFSEGLDSCSEDLDSWEDQDVREAGPFAKLCACGRPASHSLGFAECWACYDEH